MTPILPYEIKEKVDPFKSLKYNQSKKCQNFFVIWV